MDRAKWHQEERMSDWHAETEKIRNAYDRQLRQVRDDPHLNVDGKRTRIARAWLKAQADVTRIHERGKQHQAAEHLRRQRRLFGTAGKDPGEIIARRDALDRAEAAQSPDDGRRLWERASSTNDRSLAEAVLRVACDRWAHDAGWRNIVDSWAAENPTFADDLRAYIAEAHIGRSARARRALVDNMHAHVMKPSELGQLSDRELGALAGDG
jgi:hypothetical protein